jgi:hypothetical protein
MSAQIVQHPACSVVPIVATSLEAIQKQRYVENSSLLNRVTFVRQPIRVREGLWYAEILISQTQYREHCLKLSEKIINQGMSA